MPVKEADPAAKSLSEAFGMAMGAPAKPKEPPAPKPADPAAPHGRGDDGEPLAPYGLNKDGSVRKSAAGRPGKDDKARTGPAQPAGKDDGKGKPPAQLAEPGQYVKPLSDLADNVWLATSAIGKAAPRLPLVGKMIPAEKIQATGALWFATKDRAVAAFSLAAEHNAAAARFAAKLEGGDVTWVLTCITLIQPVVEVASMIWSKDADGQLVAAGQPTVAELAARNDVEMEAAISAIIARAQAAAEQQQEATSGQEAAA